MKARPLRQLVLATHDAEFAAECTDILKPSGISVLSLTDVGLLEPAGAGANALHHAAGKASAVAAFSDLPALSFAQEFRIDPLLRYGDGSGPQWTWPLPRSAPRETIHAEIMQADDNLIRGGYCGPDDRGAFIRCVLCLAWPDMEALVLEARTEGQLAAVDHRKIGRAADVFSDYFVPDGEEQALAALSPAARRRHSPVRRAIGLLRNSWQNLST